MAEYETIKGTVESKRKDGTAIKVNGEWYSAYKAIDLDHVNWKDEIEMDFVRKGRFLNVKGRPKVLSSGGGASGSSAPTARAGFSNAGVEVGHAWNSAVQIVLSTNDASSTEDIIQECAVVAARVYAVCSSLRSLAESGELLDMGASPMQELSETPTTVRPSSSVSIEPLMGRGRVAQDV